MKILAICQYYFPEQFRITNICEELVKEGKSVTVLTGLPNYPKGYVEKEYKWFRRRKEKINGVQVLRTWEIGRRTGNLFRILNYFSYALSASFKALFLGKKYDVVYVYQLSPILMVIPGIIYKKIYKKKLVLYCLDLWPESLKAGGQSESSMIYKIFSKISNWIYNSADEILVTSKSFIPNFERRLKNNIKITYLPQYAEGELELKNVDNQTEEMNIVFAGNIGKAQSIETILESARIIQEKEKNIKFHIVGNGSEYEKCKKIAQNLNNVKIYGKRPITEMQEFYNMADAMLVTLSADYFSSLTLPGKVQACMKTGNPIIASANGETDIIIKDADCGYCVEAENAELLANAIIDFYNLPFETKKKFAENSRKYYDNNFNKQLFINKLITILKRSEKNV